MKKTKALYHGHRFPAAVISHTVRWYFRFQLGLRAIEAFLFDRGAIVSYTTYTGDDYFPYRSTFSASENAIEDSESDSRAVH